MSWCGTLSAMLSQFNSLLPELFRAIDLTGVLLNGVLGGRLARIKRFDAVGFCVLAITSALGGGMVRDVLLGAAPPVALTDPRYLTVALVGAGVAMLWKLDSRPWRIALILADGMVLGCWAATGALKTLTAGFSIMPAVLLGLMTAVGGGMIRDVCAGNVPQVFGGNNLYATPALASAIVMVVAQKRGFPSFGMVVATLIGLGFTALAHRRRWVLPQNSEWTLQLSSSQVQSMLRARAARRAAKLRARQEGSTADDPQNHELSPTGTRRRVIPVDVTRQRL
ncbi:trimeric intracellular cation channel family protein [Cutibacterium sp. V970]